MVRHKLEFELRINFLFKIVFRRLSQFLAVLIIGVGLSVTSSFPAEATSCITGGQPVTQGQLVDNAIYTVCDYRAFDFHGLSATGVDFSISYLSGANFENATFPGITIGNNTNHSVNFRGATLTGADFRFADLGYSDFTGAHLTGADIHFGHYESAIFENVDFTGTDMHNGFFAAANFTGATVTQGQLDSAVLSDETICPDGEPLGLHVGGCFSALKALPPALSAPTVSSDGFTFSVTNYDEYYTFTATVISGPGVATIGSPVGANLPITVTGAPANSETKVLVTSQIGNVTASTELDYQEELAKTGLQNDSLWDSGYVGSGLVALGIIFIVARKRIGLHSS